MGCRISAANEHGAHVLRLEGDVRLTMCTALDEYFDQMFDDSEFASVWVDVTQATGLDSTTLGMLAKLAISTNDRFGFKPAIFSSNPGIDRLIATMGFSQLFDIRAEDCGCQCVDELPVRGSTEEEMKLKVLEAHKTLMGMSRENQEAFQDLVRSLEAS